MRADAVFVFDGCNSGKKVVARRGFELKDLQSAEEEGILQFSAENLLHDIRVLKVDGGKSGGQGRLRCGSAFLGSIGFAGVAIVGSTGIAIAFRGIALPEKRLTAAKEKL
jgi:hypothetical protein